DQPQQRRLSRAGWAEQREELTGLDGELDASQGVDVAIALPESSDVHGRGCCRLVARDRRLAGTRNRHHSAFLQDWAVSAQWGSSLPHVTVGFSSYCRTRSVVSGQRTGRRPGSEGGPIPQ